MWNDKLVTTIAGVQGAAWQQTPDRKEVKPRRYDGGNTMVLQANGHPHFSFSQSISDATKWGGALFNTTHHDSSTTSRSTNTQHGLGTAMDTTGGSSSAPYTPQRYRTATEVIEDAIADLPKEPLPNHDIIKFDELMNEGVNIP